MSKQSRNMQKQREKKSNRRYTLIAIDLDGTLVDERSQIKNKDLDCISKVRQLNVRVTFATGRTFRSALPFIQQLRIEEPVILCNGATIIEPQSRRILFQENVPQEIARLALSKSSQYGLDPLIYIDPLDGLPCVSALTKALEDFIRLEGFQSARIDDLENLIQQNPPLKVQVVGGRQPLGRLKQALLETFPKVPIVMTQDDYLEIMPVGISKGEALRRLCTIEGIPLDQTVAFGDALNDIELLDLAGLGIAMSHAPEALREAADETSPDVASALTKIFF
jgi:Cof subfamily protein (haloacid dehalogenase superfamily)